MPHDNLLPPRGLLFEETMARLGKFFDAKNHRPSEEQWAAIADLAGTSKAWRKGTWSLGSIYPRWTPVSASRQPLPTSSRPLSTSDVRRSWRDCLLFTRRKSRNCSRPATAKGERYAIITSEMKLNAMGAGSANANAAQIVLTTQQRIEWHLKGDRSTMRNNSHYRGKPRQVRIWDEAFLPARTMILTADDIAFLVKPLRLASTPSRIHSQTS